MQRAAVIGAKIALGIILAVSLVGQVLVIPLTADEAATMYPEFGSLRVPGIIGCVALVLCAQLALVCVWRLLSMVAVDRIFDATAFTLVDTMIGCCVAFSLLVLTALVILHAAHATQGGVTILLLALLAASLGGALILLVMRGLLRKASTLQRDMAEVI